MKELERFNARVLSFPAVKAEDGVIALGRVRVSCQVRATEGGTA